jgi:hypothetical protein
MRVARLRISSCWPMADQDAMGGKGELSRTRLARAAVVVSCACVCFSACGDEVCQAALARLMLALRYSTAE